AGPVVDRVPHDVDVALAERGEFGRRVFDEHELHVHAVLLLVVGVAVGVHAPVVDDAGRVAGPGVDGHHQRPPQLAARGEGGGGDAGGAGVAGGIGRRVLQRVEVVR